MSKPLGKPAQTNEPSDPPRVRPPVRSAPEQQPVPKPPDRDDRVTSRTWLVVGSVVCGLALVAVLVAVLMPPGRPATQGPPAMDHSVSAPLDDRVDLQFELASGANSVRVSSADLGDDLYRIATPDDSSLAPQVADGGSGLRLTLANTGLTGQASVEVQLSTKVRWQLQLAGGGTEEIVDFTTGRLVSMEFTMGASRIEVSLPRPEGTMTIRLATGAGQLAVHAPQNLPVQVKVGSGAGTVIVDDQTRNGVAANMVVASPGWDEAKDRYVVDAAGGLSTLIVDRR